MSRRPSSARERWPSGRTSSGRSSAYGSCAGEPSLRDVITFPKTGGGHDPLTVAPAPITAAQRRETRVDVKATAD